MEYLKLILPVLFFFFFCSLLHGQDKTHNIQNPPVTLEILAGNNKLFSQLILNKKIGANNKFRLLNVSSFAAEYDHNSPRNEYFSLTTFNYKMVKGISLNAGGTFNTAEGLKPLVGAQYTYASKELLVAFTPAYYFLHSQKIFNLLILEYQPTFSNNWSAYSRLQANYQYDSANESHFRSYLYLRFGASYLNTTFGVGANLDQYGAKRILQENYGAFIKMNFK